MDPRREGLGDGRRGHHGGERRAVADALGHRDDVGDHALRLEPPEVRAGAGEARLHLVGDAEAPCGSHMVVGGFQIAVGKHHRPSHALDALGDERGHLPGRAELDQVFHVGGVLLPGGRVVVAVGAAEPVGKERVVHAERVRHVELPGVVAREAHRLHTAAVVAVAEGDDVEIAGVGPGHEDGEVVGLGARVREVAHLQVAGHPGREVAGIFRDAGVEVDRGRVLEDFVLPVDGGHDLRMAVAHAHRHDPAEAVEIAAARLVVEILHVPLDDHQGLLVVGEDRGVHELPAEGEHLLLRRARIGPRAMVARGQRRGGGDRGGHGGPPQ